MRRSLFLLSAALVPALVGVGLALAGAPSLTALPLGDGHVSTSSIAVGSVYACVTPRAGAGAFRDGPWLGTTSWDATTKVSVSGDVDWPAAKVQLRRSSGRLLVRGNGLPDHTTGTFPIAASDEAYSYDRNPGRIQAQTVNWTLPRPRAAARPGCLPMGPIGVALNGVAIYNALDGQSRDAVAHEIQDRCGGHPQRTGQYHYHDIPACLSGSERGDRHSAVHGYAFDGYPITGSRGDDGTVLANADLDACHGHTGRYRSGTASLRGYHYHATREYPYTLGCFHGTPLKLAQPGGALPPGGGPPPPEGAPPPPG